MAGTGESMAVVRTDRTPQLFHRCLPVRYDVPHGPTCRSRLLTTFALQRSGQHLVIDWMCRGLIDALHVNNCRFARERLSLVLRPLMGRRVVYTSSGIHDSGVQGIKAYRKSLPPTTPNNLIYSLENQSLAHQAVRRLVARFDPYVIVILRDPANWLASSLRHGLQSKETLRGNIGILKEYLRIADGLTASAENRVLAINFNRFTEDEAYRRTLADRIGLSSFDQAEEALQHTPDFGGGSSFKHVRGPSSGVSDRHLEYREDDFFQAALRDPELMTLAEAFFGTLPYVSAVAAAR
jgi:hypothetical protein